MMKQLIEVCKEMVKYRDYSYVPEGLFDKLETELNLFAAKKPAVELPEGFEYREIATTTNEDRVYYEGSSPNLIAKAINREGFAGFGFVVGRRCIIKNSPVQYVTETSNYLSDELATGMHVVHADYVVFKKAKGVGR